MEQNSREKTIIKTSVTGIVVNVLLAAFKALAGIMSNSIAITLDAVNNLSDALSSVITIVGTKLSGKAPDKKHPFGYGRIEYLSAMIISVIVLYAGITSLVESIKKIISPEPPDYGALSLIIVAVAVGAKVALGLYVKRTGKRVNSESLVNSGADALLDSIISASTLAAAAIYIFTGLSLEAWLGAVISAFIIKSGIEMLRSTISQILGERAQSELSREIKKTVASFDEVHGAYDLIMNNYGPETHICSVHIEVDDTMNAADIDELTRRISYEVYKKHHVIMAAVGVYSMNTQNENAVNIRNEIRKTVMAHDGVLQIHGFYLNEAEKTLTFDLVIDFAVKDRKTLYRTVFDEIEKAYPDYKVQILLDADVSD
ncbi:MAG: cation transporter [Clostridia bacterium]|nr:cation transporter [Clostridia bacterium]MBQ1434859.1 cation transporter [Clostridia bacterium]MBQ4249859.1 cation transporter [Clostridia bacterium]